MAIGIAIGLTGMSSAAAGMGVTACAAMLVWACARVGKQVCLLPWHLVL